MVYFAEYAAKTQVQGGERLYRHSLQYLFDQRSWARVSKLIFRLTDQSEYPTKGR